MSKFLYIIILLYPLLGVTQSKEFELLGNIGINNNRIIGEKVISSSPAPLQNDYRRFERKNGISGQLGVLLKINNPIRPNSYILTGANIIDRKELLEVNKDTLQAYSYNHIKPFYKEVNQYYCLEIPLLFVKSFERISIGVGMKLVMGYVYKEKTTFLDETTSTISSLDFLDGFYPIHGFVQYSFTKKLDMFLAAEQRFIKNRGHNWLDVQFGARYLIWKNR